MEAKAEIHKQKINTFTGDGKRFYEITKILEASDISKKDKDNILDMIQELSMNLQKVRDELVPIIERSGKIRNLINSKYIEVSRNKSIPDEGFIKSNNFN